MEEFKEQFVPLRSRLTGVDIGSAHYLVTITEELSIEALTRSRRSPFELIEVWLFGNARYISPPWS